MTTETDSLRYPVGRFTAVPSTPDVRRASLEDVAALPGRMREAVRGLSESQLGRPYRDGGWTVRQVIHHVADSHMHGFMRLKLALTEDGPTIKPYDQEAFATLADSRLPIEVSLLLLDGIHERWMAVYRSMADVDFARRFHHPEFDEPFTLDRHLQLYAWHGRHHVGHITALRQRQGW